MKLYEPLNTLKPIGEDIWVVDGPLVRMAYPGGSMPFPTRMVVVRLISGELFLWSPTELTGGLRSEVDGLGDRAELAWCEDLNQLIFRGGRFMEEVVFFHRKTRTLILADLIENFELDKVGGFYGRLIQLAGAADPDGKAPIDPRLTFLGRKKRARASLERMEPEKVILAHGRPYDRGGTAELRRAFRWLGSE